jgi:hypothetical protein
MLRIMPTGFCVTSAGLIYAWGLAVMKITRD